MSGPDVGQGWPGDASPGLLAIQVAVFLAAPLLAWWLGRQLNDSAQRFGERFSRTVALRPERAAPVLDPRRLPPLNVLRVLAVAGLTYALSGSFWVALIGLVLAGWLPRLVLVWMQRRRRERFRLQLPDVMLLTAGGLRAGASLWQALAQVSAESATPARQEIDMMLREQRLGVSMDVALGGLERRMAGEEMRLFGAALRISQETGGNLAETPESLAGSTRRKQALEAKVEALTSQGRLQGWIMGTLPLALGLILFQLEPQAMQALFTTGFGLAVCVAIVVLQALGFYFVRRIVSVDV